MDGPPGGSSENDQTKGVAPAHQGPQRTRSRRAQILALGIAASHLVVLNSFALAQPLLELLGKNPEFFAARASPPVEIIAFALAVTFGVPLAIVLVEVLASFVHAGLQTGVHLGAVGFLAVAVVLHALSNATMATATVLIPLSIVAGTALALAYHRVKTIRTLLTVLAPAPLVFLALFLSNGQIMKLILPTEDARAQTAAVGTPTPVILVVFDEFPVLSLMDAREGIDSERYPNFAALAADSRWYRNTTTVSDFTSFAAPGIFSGTQPERGRLPIAADYPRTVFTLLGASHDITAFMPFPLLCPSGLCETGDEQSGKERAKSLVSDLSVVYGHLLLPADLRARLPAIDATWKDFRGNTAQTPRPGATRKTRLAALDERSRIFDEFIQSLGSSPEPTLHVLHTLYPHRPFDRLPSGRYYDAGLRLMDGLGADLKWEQNEFMTQQAWQRHLLQVEFTDRLLGRMLQRMKKTGLYDRALLIVTADHGASFWPNHSFRRVDETTSPDILFVPLFVKLPDDPRAGTLVDQHVQTIDIMPTIADVLDVEAGWRFDGRSLLEGGTNGLRVIIKDGSVWTGQIARLNELRRRYAEMKAETFGTGDDRPGVFGIGPNSELIGRSTTTLQAAAAGGISAQLDRAGDFRALDLGAPYLPARIAGSISAGSAPGPFQLAASLNGRVAAVAESFRRRSIERFSFIVPESAFREGANEVRVYWVRRSRGGLSLAEIGCVCE